MKRIIVVVFLLTNIMIFGSGFAPCFSYEQVQPVKMLQLKGTIVYVDFIGSTITMQYLQPDGSNDEITLQVTSHTKIDRGNLRLSLTEVHEGDEVTVTYYDDPMSFSAAKISQMNIQPEI